MQSLKRLVEWHLGLDHSLPGRGTAWSVEFGTSAGSPFSSETLLVLAAVLLGCVAAVYHREASRLSLRRRWTLAILRGMSVLLLAAMLGRLSIRVDQTDLPTVAVLVDVSGSMGLEDRYAKRSQTNSARELAQAAGRDDISRLAVAQGILTQNRSAWLRELEQRRQLRMYVFDEHLRPLPLEPEMDASAASSAVELRERRLRELTPTGSRTAPAAAVKELLEEHRGSELAAAVLLTDGAATTGDEERLSLGAELARERGVPLYAIGIGSDQPALDVELYDPLAEEVVYLGDPVTVSFRVRSFGYAGEMATLRLMKAGGDEPLAEAKARLVGDGTSFADDLTFVPDREGVFDLIVTAPPLPGEADPANNTLRLRVMVRRDRFRVLLVEGAPRWEYRALKPVLERDDAIQVDTFLQEADLNYAPEDRTALANFPATQEQLNAYDVVIWGDVDPGTLTPDVPTRLAEFVSERGGGLILIAGERHNPLEYEDTPLEDLLPVYLQDARLPDEYGTDSGFRLERTAQGREWHFMRLELDRAADEAAWENLPTKMHWLLTAPHTKPGAQTLAMHPTHDGPEGRAPAIVHQRFGRGQVLFHATDELWTWRRGVEDLYFGRYWSQAVRAMAPRRRTSTGSAGELTTDRKVYTPGEQVRLRYQIDPSAKASAMGQPVEAVIESPGGQRTIVPLTPKPAVPGAYEGVAGALPLGDFRAAVVDSSGSPSGPATLFRVEAPDREFRERSIQEADLKKAARISHGGYVPFWEAEDLLQTIPVGRPVRLSRSEPIPLWNRWEFLCGFALLLTLEWGLRKRFRLV
jgi:hypothetical protein